MIQAAKLIIIDADEQYLMLYRSAHPTFGDDPDLPGGTVDDDETPLETTVREVVEEIGATIEAKDITFIGESTDYSPSGMQFFLYSTRVNKRPAVTLSWEHGSYEWLSREAFLEKSKNANDSYMHMVHDKLNA